MTESTARLPRTPECHRRWPADPGIIGLHLRRAGHRAGRADGERRPAPDARVRIPLSHAEPARPGRRRHRHRQDQDPAAAGRADLAGRRAGVRRRHQGRPVRHRRSRARRTRSCWPAPTKIGQDWQPQGCPVEFYSLGGGDVGVPLRATVSSFGPILLAKVLGLNKTQESSLGLVFHYADTDGLPLLDLDDLRAVLTHLTSDEGKAELKEIGGLSSTTVGVILRTLITFADQGADDFFGEPEFDTADLMRITADGRGVVSLLELPNLASQPGAVLHLLDVAAGRPVHRPARGRRRRQAEAGVLLRRGAPAVQRRVEGVPAGDRPDRPADPVEGRRHLLRHPDPQGRAGRRAGPARVAGPAPAAGAHAERRQGAEADRRHLPEVALRPGGGAAVARHR